MSEEDDGLAKGPLTDSEVQTLRRIMRDQSRWDWLWASIRVWASWGAAIGAAIYASYEPILKMLKAVVGKQ